MLECSICHNQYIPTKYGKSPTCSPACTALHIANTLRERAKKIRDEKILEYNKNPTLCKQCKNSLDYGKRKGLFCDSSCAASFNSTGRVRTEESKTLISNVIRTMKGKDSKSEPLNPIILNFITKTISIRKISRKYKMSVINDLIKNGFIPAINQKRIKESKTILKLCPECNKLHVRFGETCSKTCSNKIISRKRSAWLKNPENRKLFKGHSGQSYLEESFEKWLISNGMIAGIKGYLTELHFFNKETKKHGWADFAFPTKHLIIELDGSHHNKRKTLDQVRDAHLKNRGWNVIRITQKEYFKQTRTLEIKEMLGLT